MKQSNFNDVVAMLTPKVKTMNTTTAVKPTKRIGIFPGMFNPVHNAQLLIANQVMTQLGLDRVEFMPNFISNQDNGTHLNISNADRLNMLQLALHTNPKFRLDPTELKLESRKYMYNIMKYLTKKHRDTQYYMIIGGNMIAYLPKWYNIDRLMSMVRFVGIKRSGYPIASPYPIIWVDVPQIKISSTMIRRDIRQGKSIRYFVPDLVWLYINKRHLYK